MEQKIKEILTQYQISFGTKTYSEENDDIDILMKIFNITPELKRENRQYWGRELGMVWQKIVIAVFSNSDEARYLPAKSEQYDLQVNSDAIDTKYRLGSGDAGTVKKFKTYGSDLQSQGLNPIMLILREDNLEKTIKACQANGWTVLTGDESFKYIQDHTNVDLRKLLESHINSFDICR
jgi:hypothetical protein